MFGYNGNTVNVADSITNSIEIKSPFLSFDSEKYHYYLSYYFITKELYFEYMGNDTAEEEMLEEYWRTARNRVRENLKNHKAINNHNDMLYEYITETINVILKEMDGVGK